ncbi:MAG TPA: hypothetical protein VGE79_08160, partial [Niastella sp.]
MQSRRHFIKQSSLAGLALIGPGKWVSTRENNFSYLSPFYKLELAATGPQLLFFSTDNLGQGQLSNSPVLKQQVANAVAYNSSIKKNTISYYTGNGNKTAPVWEISCDKKSFT